MKKNLIVIFSSFFICLNAFAEKPLNIFKNEILTEEAKKKMSLAYDSLKKHKQILNYNKDEEAIEITLDYSMEGHPEDWNLSDDQAQRWEFVTKKKKLSQTW